MKGCWAERLGFRPQPKTVIMKADVVLAGGPWENFGEPAGTKEEREVLRRAVEEMVNGKDKTQYLPEVLL